MYDKERLDLLKTFGVEGLPALCSRVLFALKSKFVSKQKCETDRRGGEEEREEKEEGCCLFEGLISFGKEGDGFRDENGT